MRLGRLERPSKNRDSIQRPHLGGGRPGPNTAGNMAENSFDLVVIGAGPGGYIAAIRSAQLGLKTAIVEKEPLLGGTCLRVGCIPSKALLESSEIYHAAKSQFAEHGVKFDGVRADLAAMMTRKTKIVETLAQGVNGLMGKNKIKVFRGHGRLLAADRIEVMASAGEKSEIQTKHVVIATGSKAANLRGVEIDGKVVGTSTEALEYAEVPKRFAVIGAGAIGLELSSVWNRLGADVTVFEYLPRILPEMDADVAAEGLKIFGRQGLKFELGARVTAVKVKGDEAVVECEGKSPITADKLLVAVGRIPNIDGLGAEEIGVEKDQRGRIVVDEHWMTTVPGVYAIGDVIPGPMLAHKAEEEGVACVEAIATGYGHVNLLTIPAVVYTTPEAASVGRTEQQLKEMNIPFRKGVSYFRANARARVLGDTNGFVKVLAHAETDRILGVHIIGPRAGDLIAEAAAAMVFGASSEDLARTCHAHPSTPEALKEAALAVDGRALQS
jgi:dihydrolipoamide dehydrogenase